MQTTYSLFNKGSVFFVARILVVVCTSLVTIISASLPATCDSAQTQPTGLMCELMAMPEKTVIFDTSPEFGWIVPGARGDVQSAYQVLVASSENLLDETGANMWNSGMITSTKNISVEYSGTPLSPGNTYYWKVRTWNDEDTASDWSAPQMFKVDAPENAYAGRFTTPRYRLEQTEVSPSSGKKIGKGAYFVDFGRAAFGTVEFTVKNDDGADDIIVRLGEDSGPGKKVNSFPGGTVRYRELKTTIDEGEHTYRLEIAPNERNTGHAAILMPDYIGELMPFRYCEIRGLKSGAKLSDVKQVRVHYPFDNDAATFESSDPVLNDVWELSKYSIYATTFAGVYVDGDRERIPYEADAYINQLGHYFVDREFTLARFSHEYLLQYPTWPTEWALHSVLMAQADYMYTGDAESLKEFYDTLKEKSLYQLARDDGLISTRTGKISDSLIEALNMNNERYEFGNKLEDLVDWPQGERDGYEFTDYNTVVNAFHYRTLVIMEQVARELGKETDAEFFAARAEQVRESFNMVFFNPETGLYVDGTDTTHSSSHANFFALAMGLVPEANRQSVVDFIKSKGMACSVYAAQYLLEALYDAGEADFALALMTDTETDRSWPHMINDVGTTITMEAWDMKYKPNLDWNHAWGAAPANIIPRKLMGVEPLEPGFKKVRIKPQPGNLEYARITTPTIRGPIKINYSVADNNMKTYNICLPANTQAETHLPAQSIGEISENGSPASEVHDISFLRIEDARIVLGVTSGCYSFSM